MSQNTSLAGAFATPLAGWASILVQGADAAAFLHSQLSSNVNGLAPAHGQYSSYNSPKGRMLATLVVWRTGADYRLLVAADLAEPVRKRLAMFVLRSKVTLAVEPRVPIGLYGDALPAALATDGVAAAVAWGDFAWRGHAVLPLPDGRMVALAAADTPQLPLAAGSEDAWTWLGVRAGVPWITAATSDQIIAQSANWELVGGVDFHKGCYPGQEIVARMQYLGRLKERLFAFHADTPPPAAGEALQAGDEAANAGIVVNAAAAPAGGSDFIAVTRLAALEGGAVHLAGAPATALAPLPLPYAVPALENVRVRL
ncbi:MAG: folate-binding protein YgfZ [Proteobacteria bacterium]|nr:folate-binding protein YgfZ [Pseudomonadota bacterium]